MVFVPNVELYIKEEANSTPKLCSISYEKARRGKAQLSFSGQKAELKDPSIPPKSCGVSQSPKVISILQERKRSLSHKLCKQE